MKKIFAVLCLLHGLNAVSQSGGGFANIDIGGRIAYIRPTGNFGMKMKPTAAIEIFFKTFREDGGLYFRGGALIMRCSPRQDTFPTLGMISGIGSTTLTPGWTVIHRYDVATFSFGGDYLFELSDQWRLYPGIDVVVTVVSTSYDSFVYERPERTRRLPNYFGARLRAGAEYLFESMSLFAEFNRCMNHTSDGDGLAYNDYSIGVRIDF